MEHQIKNAHLTVRVDELGAQLQSILGADGTQYLWQGDPQYWSDRALNIFPYVARLVDGCYYLDGKLYRMDIHGIAPYRNFRVAQAQNDRLVLELSWDAQTLQAYPRKFIFRVCYALQGRSLFVTYEVENRDEKTMYFGLGGHPGFNVPLAGGRFEDYHLRFGGPCRPQRIDFSEDCFVTGQRTDYPLLDGERIALRHDLFDRDAIVLTDMDHTVTLESGVDDHFVTVSYPQMEYLGIWHWPKKDAPYVCIEPWCSLPARAGAITVLEEQEDLIVLQPGQMYQNQWSITV